MGLRSDNRNIRTGWFLLIAAVAMLLVVSGVMRFSDAGQGFAWVGSLPCLFLQASSVLVHTIPQGEIA
jgi:hypothetical protein